MTVLIAESRRAPRLRRFDVARRKESKPGWAARRREQKRLKLERTGDSPQKQGERRKGSPATVRDNANRAGMGGLVSGGSLGGRRCSRARS